MLLALQQDAFTHVGASESWSEPTWQGVTCKVLGGGQELMRQRGKIPWAGPSQGNGEWGVLLLHIPEA